MLDRLETISSSSELNRALQNIIFPEIPHIDDLNLAKHWTLDTENGKKYVEKYGLSIVCNSLNAFRNKKLSHCIFAHRDMRSDVLGIPMAPGWQIAIFDQCMSADTCDPEVIKMSVYNKVLTRDCYTFLFPSNDTEAPKTQTNEPESLLQSLPSAHAENTLQSSPQVKPPSKRRKKT